MKFFGTSSENESEFCCKIYGSVVIGAVLPGRRNRLWTFIFFS